MPAGHGAASENATAAAGRRKRAAWRRFLPLGLLALGAILFFVLGGGDYLSLESLGAHRDQLKAWAAESPVVLALAYMAAYALVIALSLPVGAVLTLAGGFVFGTWLGGALTVVAATAGATALFLAARHAFADYFRDRMGETVQRMRRRFDADAFSYILALRLAPIFPFVVVNVASALAGTKLRTYVAATAIGIVPGTFVYASVGAGLDAVFAAGGEPDLAAVFQPRVLIPLALLALLALAPAVWKRVRRK